ncbi:hypothetical protein FH609_025650 [Streptomyces sp. 3MP-14]|uniref:Uncharacterized protein n=1 Tax=Streptomyces mimosae TaxID=2586635 RepID=A0A5N6A1L7_9ACTN|nr:MULTISPECIES: hypothetical protein [Streptomyces]KAB8161993.1 hypothetical protein FH607_023300 [Streptomyces mimosae]KAB8173691.1 hypothetical protein FH609_025650 [Streptomyces sp. 3MP-14]
MNTLLESGLDSAERLLGARFLLGVLLPLTLAAGASGAVVLAASGHTPGEALRAWQRFDASGQLTAAVLALLALVCLARVLALFQLPLLRLLEGYWPAAGPLDRLSRRGTRRQTARARAGWERVRALGEAGERTAGTALAARLLTGYPPPPRLADGVLPTALGNRLRAAEYYPLERYGIDAVVVWPRLVPLLPAEAAARLTSARTALDGTVNLFALALAFGVCWPPVLLAVGEPASLAALCLLALPVAWAAHRAALAAAVGYGQEVRVVFDLHRRALLDHLEVEVPRDPAEERRLWGDLGQFYQRNLPFDPRPRRGTDPGAAGGDGRAGSGSP